MVQTSRHDGLRSRARLLLLAAWAAGLPVAGTAQTPPDEARMVIRAHRLAEPLQLDGRLDEPVYAATPPSTDFVQQVPREGEPATEKTEVWIFFDDRNVHVSVRAWDSHPERMVASEMRRDSRNISQNENFAIIFDTFHDRRNGFYFQTNPLGAIRDQTFTDEGNPNADWNTLWDVKTASFSGGWTLEMVIPFKSLRYPGPGPQEWGVNFRRTVAWKNEASFGSFVPAAYAMNAIYRASFAATLVGLETPAQSTNLEVKPYVISALKTDRGAPDPFSNDWTGDAGFDVKYGITRGLTADFTYNTDFAQVEADEQQINLTRFSLQFPEKRDFFLEGRGIFNFGSSPGAGPNGDVADAPVLFFSRRIGLSEGQSVPVRAGARVTGKAGAFTVGALNVQTGENPAANAAPTNFSVLRLKRDVLSRSSVGMIATHRAPTLADDGSNTVVGLDASMLFLDHLSIATYYARTETPGRSGDDASYRGQVDYAGDRYGLRLEHLMVGDAFDPQVGFLRREDFRRSSVQARFSPRPRSVPGVRRLVWQGGVDYVTGARDSRLESREAQGMFRVEMENSDAWSVQYTRSYEFLDRSFRIGPGVEIGAGGYDFGEARATAQFGQQRRLSGDVRVGSGSFYGGRRTEVGSAGRLEISSRLSVEPALSLNWVELPEGSFTARLATARAIFAPSPRSVVSSLLQYNSSTDAWSSNVRFQWEYAPGSELFVVYSDGRNGIDGGFPELTSRTVAVKLTRLVRF